MDKIVAPEWAAFSLCPECGNNTIKDDDDLVSCIDVDCDYVYDYQE